MNSIDLIVCLILLLAVWNGWRQGLVVQVCSLAGIIIAIWLAAHYGARVGEWLRLDESFSAAGGFVAVLVVVVLVVAVIGRLLRGAFRFAGFGLVDTLLGVVVAVLKYLLVLSALFAAFDRINADYTLVEARTIDQSRSYKPVLRLSEAVFPFLEWVGDRVPELDEKSEDDGA